MVEPLWRGTARLVVAEAAARRRSVPVPVIEADLVPGDQIGPRHHPGAGGSLAATAPTSRSCRRRGAYDAASCWPPMCGTSVADHRHQLAFSTAAEWPRARRPVTDALRGAPT